MNKATAELERCKQVAHTQLENVISSSNDLTAMRDGLLRDLLGQQHASEGLLSGLMATARQLLIIGQGKFVLHGAAAGALAAFRELDA